jgi:hypothetical protein
MNWPQITWIALAAAGVAISAVKHGESRGSYSVLAHLDRHGYRRWPIVCGRFLLTMFRGESWFAWHPVKARTRSGQLIWVWLTHVWRDQASTPFGSGPFRYYLR